LILVKRLTYLILFVFLTFCSTRESKNLEDRQNDQKISSPDTIVEEFGLEKEWIVATFPDDDEDISPVIKKETKATSSYQKTEEKEIPDSTEIAERIERIRKLRQLDKEVDLAEYSYYLEMLEAGKDLSLDNIILLGQNRYLTIQYDNDIFSNTDWYYTNGVRFDYTNPNLSRWPLMKILLPYRKNSINFYGISLVHKIFTPLDPDLDYVPYGDRPFAAYLYFGQFKVTNDLNKNLRLVSEFDLGIIGPAAMGGLIQETVHGKPPTGWDYQVENDIIINYLASIEKTILNSRFLNIDGSAEVNLGILYTNIGAAASIRTGLFDNKVLNVTSPRTWNQLYPTKRKFQFFLYYLIEGRLIGYDATLQGGVFNKSDYTLSADQINRTVYEQQLGLVGSLNKLSLSLVQVWLSPEFEGGLSHKWMEIKVSVNL